jgi:hypothetical protein
VHEPYQAGLPTATPRSSGDFKLPMNRLFRQVSGSNRAGAQTFKIFSQEIPSPGGFQKPAYFKGFLVPVRTVISCDCVRFDAKFEKFQVKQKERVMLRLAGPCEAVQNAEKWTQNPSEAIPWGFDSPPGTTYPIYFH